MKQNIITISFLIIAILGVAYGVACNNNNELQEQLESIDEQIMQLQYEIDLSQANYTMCESLMSISHEKAEAKREKIKELNQKKAELVGLEME